MEALLAEYKSKCEEELAVCAQLAAARLDLQQLKIRLQANGVTDATSLIPKGLRAGGARATVEAAYAQHKSVLEWLGEIVDVTASKQFFAPGELSVGEHTIHLGTMMQFRGQGDMNLNVPVDCVNEILALLAKCRCGRLGPAVLSEIAESWALLGAEIVAVGETQPAIFLVHRKSSHAIVVGSWPSLPERAVVQPCAATVPLVNPVEHFKTIQDPLQEEMGHIAFVDTENTAVCLTPVQGGGFLWSVNGCVLEQVHEIGIHFNSADQCTISSLAGSVIVAVPVPGPPQRGLARQIIAMASEQEVQVRCDSKSRVILPPPEAVSASCVDAAFDSALVLTSTFKIFTGDRVDVEYYGEWFRGVLQHIDGEIAHVRCDQDEPSVVTLAPISSIRPAMTLPTHHRRSKSWTCPS